MNYFHFAVLAYALFAVYVLYMPVVNLWRGYLVRHVLSHVSVTQEGFSMDLPSDYGYLTVWSDGSRVHYSFAKHGETDSVAQALVPETHTLVADRSGKGKLVFPAFLPKGFLYSGVVVAFAVPSYAAWSRPTIVWICFWNLPTTGFPDTSATASPRPRRRWCPFCGVALM